MCVYLACICLAFYFEKIIRRKCMSFVTIFITSIALAMDAFGVSLSLAISDSSEDKKLKSKVIYLFGFFQFILAFLGGVLGFYFNNYVMVIPEKLLGMVIAIVGVLMIYDGKKKNNCKVTIKNGVIIFLGISVSIDALAVSLIDPVLLAES